MQIPILIDPIEGGRFRARSGEPFGLSAEGASREDAARHLEQLLKDRLCNGAELRAVNMPSAFPSLPSGRLRN